MTQSEAIDRAAEYLCIAVLQARADDGTRIYCPVSAEVAIKEIKNLVSSLTS